METTTDLAALVDSARALHGMGRLHQAMARYRSLAALAPSVPALWTMIGLCRGQLDQADHGQAFMRATWLEPGDAGVHGNLGASFQTAGANERALRPYRRAIALDPGIADAVANFGGALVATQDSPAALRWLRRCLCLRRNHAGALNNLGHLWLDSGELERADEVLSHALDQNPENLDARFNRALIAKAVGRLAFAAKECRVGLALSPGIGAPILTLGSILAETGDLDLGHAWHLRTTAIAADNAATASALLASLAYRSDVSEVERAAAYRRWASRVRTTVAPRPPAFERRSDRPLRIGYMSPDFCHHPVGRALERLLSHHDPSAATVFCYGDLRKVDDVTERCRALAGTFRETTRMRDSAVADLIRADEIDVLILVAQHDEGGRRRLPALRPAPVQASLFDIATCGLPEVDWWIADSSVCPEDSPEWFAEKIWRIPRLYCLPPPTDAPPPAAPPCLTSGRPTFGSFNNPSKLSGRALDLWAQILDRIPDTRLVLKYRNLFADPLVTTRIANAFGRRGVDPGRIEFATGGFTSSEHLALYAQVDVALDPFPFNGNTSTLEALWMGVPVVSLAGERCVSRMGLALLRSIGADEWAATSEVEYVTKAVSLAGKGAELATLRSTLRPRVRNSPLCDYHAYARSLESAYRGMYRSAIGTTSLRDGAAPPILVPDPT